MMTRGPLYAGILLSGIGSAAFAQAPAAPASPPGATTIEQDKRGTTGPAQTQRATDTRPGTTLPMNIKIQGEGVKMPACTAESREGEACKK